MTCSPEALELLEVAVAAANDALAEDPVAIDVTDNLPFTDAFLIISADNPRHMRAVSDQLSDGLREKLGVKTVNVEGDQDSDWMLMDFGPVIVHVMLPEARTFYALEKLWGRSPRIKLSTASV